jgi:hypothetical protein
MANVARLSEVGEGLYETLVRPLVRAMTTEATAEALRASHPDRVQRRLVSDANPFLAPLGAVAEMVRADRRPVGEDNPFLQAERAMSDAIVNGWNRYRDARDQLQEQAFFAIWTHPLVETLAGNAAPHAAVTKPRASRRQEFRDKVATKLEAIRGRCREGGVEQGLVRLLAAGVAASSAVVRAAMQAARTVWKRERLFTGLSRRQLLRVVKEEAFLLEFDRAYAIETLPELLRTRAERERAVAIAREVLAWRPDLLPRLQEALTRIETVLGLDHPPAPPKLVG